MPRDTTHESHEILDEMAHMIYSFNPHTANEATFDTQEADSSSRAGAQAA